MAAKVRAMSPIRQSVKRGFTLMELMVVVIIIGIIAAFGMPNYQKSVQKAHERDMVAQLTMLHVANLLYKSYNGRYWNTSGADQALASINSTLAINIIPNAGTTYNYNSADGSTFTATATWRTNILRVTQVPIAWGNPCCQSKNCISGLPNC